MTHELVALDAAEVAQLTRFEERIQQGLASFIEVGEALSAIRERRLYRASHGTFDDYCVSRWGMKRNYANKLVAAAEAVRSLPAEMVTIVTNEAQAREIAAVPAPERAAVVEKAIQATGGKITAAAIREAAKPEPVAPVAESVEVVIEPPKTKAKPAAPAPLYTSYGLMYADLAISQLEKIANDDTERAQAFAKVREYLSRHGG